MDGLVLLPRPRRTALAANSAVKLTGFLLAGAPTSEAAPAMRVLERFFSGQGTRTADSLPLNLKIVSSVSKPQGYALKIAATGVDLVGHDAAGLLYGAHTLAQLLTNDPRQLPTGTIEDFPDFPVRGVMLDVSRDKVPTMATLFSLTDLLASWKINQLQLYIEHTFAYKNHREVWEHASPFTAEEIRALDAYCRERLIDLVPNQNSFGHMERWLKHEKYRPRAEAPDGSETPWDFRWEGPFSLCPTDPKSVDLLKELYAEYLPNFSSKLFNVGCDETFDIGQGRSKAACEASSVTRVYLDFLLKVHKLVKSHGRTMQFWGDIIIKHPELIAELPKDVIALEWGYDANHPFDTEGGHFANAGVPFYVCPGTSSWCTITGRTDNALANLRNAAVAGMKHGAIGFLNTDWGDYGHLQYLPISYLPFAAGAGVSWCEASNRDTDFTAATSLFAFGDSTGRVGRLMFDFGNIYRLIKKGSGNGSRLFRLLVPSPNEPDPAAGVASEDLATAEQEIDRLMADLDQIPADNAEEKLIAAELKNAAAMLSLACVIGRRQSPDQEELHRVIVEHRRLWLARNRPGGLDDSAARLEKHLVK